MATSLARLLDSSGNRKGARALLAPIHGWYIQGLTPRPKGAKALLEIFVDLGGTKQSQFSMIFDETWTT